MPGYSSHNASYSYITLLKCTYTNCHWPNWSFSTGIPTNSASSIQKGAAKRVKYTVSLVNFPKGLTSMQRTSTLSSGANKLWIGLPTLSAKGSLLVYAIAFGFFLLATEFSCNSVMIFYNFLTISKRDPGSYVKRCRA